MMNLTHPANATTDSQYTIEITMSNSYTLDPNTEIDDGSQPEKKADDDSSSDYSFTQLSDKAGTAIKKLAFKKFSNTI